MAVAGSSSAPIVTPKNFHFALLNQGIVLPSRGRATFGADSQPWSHRVRSGPTVVSLAVWWSISAPTRTTMPEIQIQVMKPITAPSEP